LILFASIFAMAIRAPVDTDMWWHLASGRYAFEVQHAAPLRKDVFSHTVAGKEWVNHSWLSQLIMYGLYRLGGLPALSLGTALVVTLAMLLVHLQSRGNVYWRGFALLLTAITSAVIWAPRPQMLSFLCFALLSYLLKLHVRAGFKPAPTAVRYAVFPVLFILWANFHSGYIGGLILMGCYLAGAVLDRFVNRRFSVAIRPLVLLLIICTAVVLVNPSTYKLLLYPFTTTRIGVLQKYIQEWASPDFHQLFVQPFIWLLLATLAAIGFSGLVISGVEFVPLAVFCYMALLAGRNIALFALVAGPILARYGDVTLRRVFKGIGEFRPSPPSRSERLVNLGILVLVIVAVVIRAYSVLNPGALLEAEKEALPYGAVEFIRKAHPPGRMFNSYNWGGYLIWKLYPDYPVFVDGRTDLYGDRVLNDYLRAALAKPGWDRVLDKYGIGFVVVEQDSPLAHWLERESAWRKTYEDEKAVVFVRL